MARKINIQDGNLKNRSYKKRISKKRNILCKILIVCEGEKTEPDYFRHFHKTKPGTFVIDLTLQGGGINTIAVVNKAIEYKQKAINNNQPYDRVWAVFDKDSFPERHFNAAIQKAHDNNINCAWSNEAFELWYLLHFHNRVTPMKREEYNKAISDAVNQTLTYQNKKKKYKYQKNDRETIHILTKHGNQENAIKFARSLHQTYKNQKYATHNPCTTVYQLVEQLLGKDQQLNDEITQQVEA